LPVTQTYNQQETPDENTTNPKSDHWRKKTYASLSTATDSLWAYKSIDFYIHDLDQTSSHGTGKCESDTGETSS
jgi:hypothetical protein